MATKTVKVDAKWDLLERGPVTIETISYDGDGDAGFTTSNDDRDPSADAAPFANVARIDGKKKIDATVEAGRFLWVTIGMGHGGNLTYTTR